MTRSNTLVLAQWFVCTILRRHWTRADFSGSHMKHASMLLKMGYKVEEVQGCCLALVKNPDRFEGWTGDWPLRFMVTILKGEPPFITQFLQPPDPPPVYETRAYDEWVMNWGAKAIRLGLWNGIYAPINEPHRLSSGALRIILGEEYVRLSLEKKIVSRPVVPTALGVR